MKGKRTRICVHGLIPLHIFSLEFSSAFIKAMTNWISPEGKCISHLIHITSHAQLTPFSLLYAHVTLEQGLSATELGFNV